MKKSLYIFFAAALAVASVACTKEEFGIQRPAERATRTFTVSFDEGDQTKTTLTQQGKTVWAEGDVIWVSNGHEFDTLTVSKEAVGQKYFEFTTTLTDTLYVVYPFSAAKGVSEVGKVEFDVPATQDGTFGSANICVAMSKGRTIKLRNVTSVLQIRIPNEATKPTKVISINAIGNAVAGSCTVDLNGEEPVVTASQTGSEVILKTDGLTGKFYASVIPGTYNSGFSMTAVSTQLACESKATTEAKELKINSLYDLGKIGADLKTIQGQGTEAAPYVISNSAEYLALSYYVKEGNTMAGQYVKQAANLSGISTMIGSYSSADVNSPFKGNYDGAGFTTSLSIAQRSNIPAGMFACVADSAYIHNVVVDGTIQSNGSVVGGLVGRIDATNAPVKLEAITNKAAVSGSDQIGGVVGFATTTTNGSLLNFTNLKNEGAITASGSTVGGLFGYLRATAGAVKVTKCSNSGAVTSNLKSAPKTYYIYNAKLYASGTSGSEWSGAGGLFGYILRSDVTECENTGAVTGYMKVGGIAGMSMATYIGNTNNSGAVTATGGATYNTGSQTGWDYGSCAGGIVGWMYSNGGVGEVNTCVNTATISARGNSAGIVGYSLNNGSKGYIKKCVNKGEVAARNAYFGGTWATISSGVGGIVGTLAAHNASNYTLVQDCKNEAAVSTDKAQIGGIVGRMYSGTNNGVNLINRCENYGSVTGQFYCGGITGTITCPYNQNATIRNCMNKGTVTANRANDAGECTGGILGANCKTNSSTSYKPTTNIWNCYNEGDVVYADSTHVKPYLGGIVGRVNYVSNIANVYNTGYVGTRSKTAPAAGAEKYLGILVGSHEVANSLNFAYWKAGCAPEGIVACGTTSAATQAYVTSFDDSGKLAAKVVTPNEETSETVLAALNAWYNTAVNVWKQTYYYSWVEGAKAPVFLYPSYTDEFDAEGLDLGNGGEI